ncbi:hypothetical protein N7493_003129 [Penicillium malachiteum]|uniref:Uncharacterized protein n=1 Tax=Penicillium malachiteum TaxID=1324776 RepID=A0AAD6HTR7_9EURO|nr:hypothetical protein N7493_003129 [Penicillium malachiteum]
MIYLDFPFVSLKNNGFEDLDFTAEADDRYVAAFEELFDPEDNLLEPQVEGERASCEESSNTTDRSIQHVVTSQQTREDKVRRYKKGMAAIVNFLYEEAIKTSWADIAARKGWMVAAFWFPLRRSAPEMITKLFLHITPLETQEAPGSDPLTGEAILAIPKATLAHRNRKGVYLDCATTQPPHASTQTGGKTALNDVVETPKEAIHAGSSTIDVVGRVLTQEACINRLNLGHSDKKAYHHRMIVERNLCPNFRIVATYPKKSQGCLNVRTVAGLSVYTRLY